MLTRRTVLKQGGCVVLASSVPLLIRPALAQTTTFDYYISPTGSDSNSGTSVSSPWAITSLASSSSHQSAMAGKRIGLMPGVYPVYGMWQSASYNAPALVVPSGTAAVPTYIASCDANGSYSPRTAQITASPSGTVGGGYPGGGTASVSIMGNVTGGYVTFDGLSISDGSGYALYLDFRNTGDTASCTIQNCVIFNVTGTEGKNPGGISIQHDHGSIIQNNKIYNVQQSGGHNCAGIFSFACTNHQYLNNTFYNCNCAIYDKDQNNSGHTYYANYFEINGAYPFGALNDFGTGNSGTAKTVRNNIFVIGDGGVGCGVGANDVGNSWTPLDNMVWYNNTIYALGGWQMGCLWQCASPATVTHYNNIYVGATPSNSHLGVNPNPGTVLTDYNCYSGGSTGRFETGTGGAQGTVYTLAGWQSAFGRDTHSINGSPNFTNPGQLMSAGTAATTAAAGYQLGSGSSGLGSGRSNGTSGGTACNMGAWGGASPPTQIGCNFAVAASSAVPNAPVLTVS